jgi:alkaline phosphatase
LIFFKVVIYFQNSQGKVYKESQKMKTRAAITIIVASLVTLLVCAGVVQAKPKNIIFFVGDGMGPEQVKAAGIYAYGAPGTLSFESFPYQGRLTTYSANSSIPDSAAAATAMATGFKVNNDVISMAYPGNGSELETLLEYYKSLGKSTGLVTTTYVEHATPAAFGAHEPSRDNYTNIANDYLTQTQPNILFGGCGYTSAADSYGYVEVFDRAGMQALDTDAVDRVSGQFGSGYMPYEYDGLGSLPHLSEMTATALDILDKDADGFFLMVEGGMIDQACHSNDLIRSIYETIEFANAVQVAIEWAAGRNDTLILVAADHETGGLTVTANNGAGVLPSVTWATTGHTAANVPAYAWGVNAELISGVMDNTEMFEVVTTDMPVASNPSPADGVMGVSPISLSLSATVHNPSGTTDPVDVEFFGREKPSSFTIVAIGDTQNYTQSGTKAIYDAQIQWIVDNAASMNIVFVTHQGDIVDAWDNTTEWANAADSMSIIDPGLLNLSDPTGLDPLIPYGVLPGNHDKEDVTNDSSNYNNTFPYDRYEGVVSWYGGHYGTTNNNNYEIFSAGGDDYIILHIEDWPDDGVWPSPGGVIEWAKSILTTYSDRKAIITTHGYLTTSGGYAGKWGSTQYIRTNLVEAHDNVYFMLCGHHTGEYDKTTTVGTRDIHELLSCYHAGGWLRIMRFEPDEDKVYVQTYSPWLDSYQTDDNSEFELDFPMTSNAFVLIGSDTDVADGGTASVAWPGLPMETQYVWYVTVADTVTPAIMAGPVWSFTTASLKASNPNPANGATDVDVDADLSWSPGVDALSHDVYLGTNPGNLPRVSQLQSGTTYDPGLLQLNTTYYWAIDEFDSGGSLLAAGDVWSFTTSLPSQPNTEDFESGYTIGQKIGTHPDWYDGGGGPTVTSGIGVGGSVGLAPANNIFTWTAHPFVWTEVNKVIIGMDFQTDGSAHFDDDRIGWMISSTSTDSSNIFGVQMDPGGSGYNIEGYWDGVSAADKTPGIVNLPALSANAWYRLRAEFTRLTDTSAAIDVELWSLDSGGNPIDLVAGGSIPDTSTLGSDAPHSKYFNATTMWPAYKNYTAAGAPADNACFEIVPLGPINQPPIAADDSSATDEDTPLVIEVLSNDTDPENDPIAVESVTQPSNGIAANNGTNVTYTPNPDFSGADTFTYLATDGANSSNVATVTITVNAINDAPVADGQAVSVKENTPTDITLTGSDVDGDTLTYAVVAGPTNGALSGTAPNLTYTPGAGYSGPDSFTFKVNDGTVDSDIATVSITIAANNIPLADDQAVAAGEDVPLAITLTGSDADSDPLTFSVVTSPTNGTLSGTAPNLTYTPNSNFNGSDSFTYRANDGTVDSPPATVTITVNAVNDDPVANNDTATTNEDTGVTISVLGNDSDPDGDTLTVSGVTQGANGSVANNGTDVTYTPNANFFGSDSFTYTANDGKVNSSPATVTVTVEAVNDKPAANNDSATTQVDTPATIAVLANDTDADGDTLTVTNLTPPANGTATLNPDKTVTYTPKAGFSGIDSFTYTANDGTIDSDVSTVTMTVTVPTLFSDGFESGNLTAGGWTISGSATVSTAAAYNGTYGAYLKKAAWIQKAISTAGYKQIHIKFARKTGGMDSGEYLYTEWTTDGSVWSTLETTQATTWTSRDLLCPAGADNSAGFRLRFRTNANLTAEYAYVDAVEITGTPMPPDNVPPSPDPMTWGAVPYATSSTSISMTATTATDSSGVEYYFACVAGGGHDSAWQSSPSYEDTGLSPDTTYTYTVTARDLSANHNQTAASTAESATTNPAPEWTELTYDDFESGWGNYTDGGGDCSLYAAGAYAHQGSHAADVQDNGGTASSFFYTNGVDVHTPGYTQIKVEFWFYAVSMETGEDFWLQYYDGSAWRTVKAWASGANFSNGTFYNPVVYINEAGYTLPTNMKIRFMCDAGDNDDDVYIDEVRVSAK